MPFSDPMADGPSIQAAGQRALKAGTTLRSTLAMVQRLREADPDTPYVLMGYYNPIYRYGADAFARDAVAAGVDGAIIVDLPPGGRSRSAAPSRPRPRPPRSPGRPMPPLSVRSSSTGSPSTSTSTAAPSLASSRRCSPTPAPSPPASEARGGPDRGLGAVLSQ